jgi:carboxyl-terminal processing protease
MTVRRRIPLGVTLLAVFCAGAMFGASALSRAQTGEVFSKLDVFARVLHYVQTNYVDPVDDKILIYGAIRGMLDTLDPHTVFMPPDIYQEMKIDTTGEFQGLGLVIEARDDRLAVVDPIPDSPAERAGVQRGDIIVAIDGASTQGMTLQKAIEHMRGRIGTSVALTIEREGLARPETLSIMRARITMNSVTGRLLDSGIGYVRVTSFQDHTAAQLTAEIKKIAVECQGPLEGLVLDLRGNPGGLFTEAVRMCDEFLRGGVIVTTEGRNGTHIEREDAHDSGVYLAGRLVVLINGGTASASEIVAGALKDHKRALLVGNRSFGKGSVQNIIDLDDGSGLKITVARYFTPNRQPIDREGIAPDVNVAQPDELRLSVRDNKLAADELPVAFTDEKGLKLLKAVARPESISADDHQLLAAYNYLVLGQLP